MTVLKSTGEMSSFRQGEVLVADMTDPDWEHTRKKAGATVTNRGGHTSRAAFIARELGTLAFDGSGGATGQLSDGAEVTVSCTEGDTGRICEGLVKYERTEQELSTSQRWA